MTAKKKKNEEEQEDPEGEDRPTPSPDNFNKTQDDHSSGFKKTGHKDTGDIKHG